MLKPGLTPLVPVLSLIWGAVIIPIVTRFRLWQERDALALVMAGVAFVTTLFLTCQPASYVVISPWLSWALLGSPLAYITKGLAAPLALLTSLVCLAIVISLSGWRREADDDGRNRLYPMVFLASAAGLSFIYSANLITLCLSWAFLDLSLLFLIAGQRHRQIASETWRRALIMSSLTGLSLVMATLLPESPSLAFILLLAALVRAGFYPLHFWILTASEAKSPANTLLQAISITTGLALLARAQEFSPQGLPCRSQLIVISSLALVATALSAWAEQDRRRGVSWVALNQIVLAVLSVAVVGQSPSVILWSAINLALCLSLLNLEPPERAGKYGCWYRVPMGLALASLMGLPFTMGFVGRAVLYRSLFALSQPCLWSLSTVADVGLFAALFRIGADRAQCSANSPFSGWMSHLASAVILAVPLLWLGVYPPLAGPLAVGTDLPTAAEWIGQADPALWAVLLLPLAGGYLLYQGQKVLRERSAAFWKGLAALLRLDWFHRWFWKAGWGIGAVWRGLARIMEGEGYLGWTLLLALIVFLLLSGR